MDHFRFRFWKSVPSSALGLSRYLVAFETASQHRTACANMVDDDAVVISGGSVIRTTKEAAKKIKEGDKARQEHFRFNLASTRV